jgi:hypothetical protein
MKHRPLSICRFTTGWWFRVFGYGLQCMIAAEHPLLFSERYGYKKFLYVGKWKIATLTP